MTKNSWIVPTLIVLGIGLIVLSLWAPQKKINFGSDSKKLKIATVLEKIGSLKVANNELSIDTEAQINYKIQIHDLLKTDAQSDALIEFNSGGQFRLVESTEVLLDVLESGQPVVILRSGDVLIEKFGKSPSFWIRKEGQMYSAVDFALLDKNTNSKLIGELENRTPSEQLTQIEIENTLSQKKTDFFKCYGQVIQKNHCIRLRFYRGL